MQTGTGGYQATNAVNRARAIWPLVRSFSGSKDHEAPYLCTIPTLSLPYPYLILPYFSERKRPQTTGNWLQDIIIKMCISVVNVTSISFIIGNINHINCHFSFMTSLNIEVFNLIFSNRTLELRKWCEISQKSSYRNKNCFCKQHFCHYFAQDFVWMVNACFRLGFICFLVRPAERIQGPGSIRNTRDYQQGTLIFFNWVMIYGPL